MSFEWQTFWPSSKKEEEEIKKRKRTHYYYRYLETRTTNKTLEFGMHARMHSHTHIIHHHGRQTQTYTHTNRNFHDTTSTVEKNKWLAFFRTCVFDFRRLCVLFCFFYLGVV